MSEDLKQSQKPEINKNAENDSVFKIPQEEELKKPSKISKLLKPKVIILIIVILLFFALILALISMQKKTKTSTQPGFDVTIASPNTQDNNKPVNPKVQTELDILSKRIDNLNSENIDFTPPNIDFKALTNF